ncbi:MAG: response regulator [Anaerolineae bacterium]|nr:response regulator [Anaerolineae bacterium]
MAEKILVVDDDLETVRLVSLVLQRQGYEVATAFNGEECIAKAGAQVFDLILLDVMMPDMDGYQVTRILRGNPQTASVAILMFTAKSQVEDKVAGYECGVDEYLAKPVHPAELVARIKALLTRQKKAAPAVVEKSGYSIAVMAPKGGLGASTLTLNLGINLARQLKKEIIAAEFRPGHGTWAYELNLSGQENLSNLLRYKPIAITNDAVERALILTTYGLRLLMASQNLDELRLVNAVEQFEVVHKNLLLLSPVVLLDFGHCTLPDYHRLLEPCKEIIVITEPYPLSVKLTQLLIEDLNKKALFSKRRLTVVLFNRMRSDVSLTVTRVRELLGLEIAQTILPSPELAYQAGMQNVPFIQVQPQSLPAKQYEQLAATVISHIPEG